MKGTMVISLDFELLWGLLDHETVDSYGENILGARIAVGEILKLFQKYGIHATWGIVGFLFYSGKQALKDDIPSIIPQYRKKEYSTYSHIEQIKKDEEKYYFAPDLIKKYVALIIRRLDPIHFHIFSVWKMDKRELNSKQI